MNLQSALLVSMVLSLPVFAHAQSSTRQTTTTTTTDSPSTPLPRDPAPMPVEVQNPTRQLLGVNIGVGIPRLTNIGLTYVSPNQYLTAEIGGGGIDAKSNDVKVKSQNIEAALRYHPWSSAFFIGAAVGDQRLRGEGSDVVNSTSVAGTIDVKSTYVTPQVGWLWHGWEGGFFGQVDLGYQQPLSSSVSYSTTASNTTTPEYQKFERDVRDAGKKLGEDGLPSVALKIGWLF